MSPRGQRGQSSHVPQPGTGRAPSSGPSSIPYWAEWEGTGVARGPPAGQRGQCHPPLVLTGRAQCGVAGHKAVPRLPPQGEGQSPEGWWPQEVALGRGATPPPTSHRPAPNLTRRCSGLPGWVLAAGGTGTTRTRHPVPELGPAGDKQPWLERGERAGRRRRRRLRERKVSLSSSKPEAAAALKPGGGQAMCHAAVTFPGQPQPPNTNSGVLKVLPLPLPPPVSLPAIPRAQHAKNRVVTQRTVTSTIATGPGHRVTCDDPSCCKGPRKKSTLRGSAG